MNIRHPIKMYLHSSRMLGTVLIAVATGSLCAAVFYNPPSNSAPVHGPPPREKLGTLQSSVSQNQYDQCVECGVQCTPGGLPCCGTCECVGHKGPTGQTFWHCEETW